MTNAKTIRKIGYEDGLIAFGAVIKRKLIATYEIIFKINGLKRTFYIGFADSLQAIKNYSQNPGCGANRKDTLGLEIKSDANIYLYDKYNYQRKLDLLNPKLLREWINKTNNIKFKMFFDLLNKTMTLSINNDKLVNIKHIYNYILPMFSLRCEGDQFRNS